MRAAEHIRHMYLDSLVKRQAQTPRTQHPFKAHTHTHTEFQMCYEQYL